ncbi:hypothetical protein GCM10027422_16100 [Hymenobacter arcticus]
MAASLVNPGLSEMEQAQISAAFPMVASLDLTAVMRVLPTTRQVQERYGNSYPVVTLLSSDAEEVRLSGLTVRLPGRVYFAEPLATDESTLPVRQQVVRHCIYLRHHDGYVRQRRLEQLLAAPYELFTVPFTFSLIGEYVKEILEVLDTALLSELLASYVGFIQENPRYWQRTQGRVTSYWDVYYRGYYRGGTPFRHYVGARLLKKLKHALQQAMLS